MDTLVEFLIVHNFRLLAPPINGRVSVILRAYEDWGGRDFSDELRRLFVWFPQAVVVEYDVIVWLDVPALVHVHRKNKHVDYTPRIAEPIIPTTLLGHFQNEPAPYDVTPETGGDDQVMASAFVVDFASFHCQLMVPVATLQLQKMVTTGESRTKPFYGVCQDQSHQHKLGQVLLALSAKSVLLVAFHKLVAKSSLISTDITECLQTYTHYVPIVNLATDPLLGDCLYLDGCHKKDTCRYIHYLTVDPLYPPPDTKQFPLPDYDTGTLLRHHSHRVPPQWVCCDLRYIPFDIFGKYAAIIADPAWKIHVNATKDASLDEEFGHLDIPKLQDEGVLMVWSTARTLERARDVMRKWGYQVNDEVLWIKVNQLKRTIVTGRTGHWLNHSKEHLVVGVKGRPRWLRRQIDLDYVVSNCRETSRKPDEIYDIVERMVGPHARKLELFGRTHNTRPGWMTLGGQLLGHHIEEPEVKHKYDQYAAQRNPRGLNVSEFADQRRPSRKKKNNR